MEQRFGRTDLPNILRRQLQDIRQEPEESLQEYAERAQELASDGFPGAPEEFLQMMGTDAFIKGLLDKRAALTVLDKDSQSLDEALRQVRSAVTNQRLILGSKYNKAEVKRVSFAGDEGAQQGLSPIRSVRKTEVSPTNSSL